MLDNCPAAVVFHNPLATPPPDDDSLNNANASASGAAAAVDHSFSRLRINIDSNLQHSSILDYNSAPNSGLSTLPSNSRYTRSYDSSASAPAGGERIAYEPAFGHSAEATSSVTGSVSARANAYPSSPPPSRQHSDHGCDLSSGTNRFTSQSPVSSPVGAPATDQRLNLPFPSSLNPSSSQNHLSSAPHNQSTQAQQQQQLPPQFKQTASHPNLHGLAASQQQFPPLSTMLASDRYPRAADRFTYPPPPPPERRMSEPATHFAAQRQYSAHTPSSLSVATAYTSPSYGLQQHQRGSRSIGSFSDVTAGTPTTTTSSSSLTAVSVSGAEWTEESKQPHHHMRHPGDADSYSPIQTTFSNGSGSSLANNGLHSPHNSTQTTSGYSSATVTGGYSLYGGGSHEDLSQYNDGRPQSSGDSSQSPQYPYQPLPPLNQVPLSQPTPLPAHPAMGYGGNGSVDSASKTYSFVSLPGNSVRKRPRRRYDEIERLYACSFPGCSKAYGTLNHLNAHVNMQKHGPKRHPNEFKEMRKQWRKAKKEAEAERESRNRELPDIMRRRRATDPSPFDPYGNAGSMHQGGVSALPEHMSGIHPNDLPVAGYALSGAGAGGGLDSTMGGYGHHHYVAQNAYATHHAQRAPMSPLQSDSPPPNGSRGNMLAQLTLPSLPGTAPGGGYDALDNGAHGHGGHNMGQTHHGYGSHHPHSHPPSPPPLNRLPQDSVLLTPLSGHGYGQHGGDFHSGLPPLSSSLGRLGEHHHS